MHRPLSHFAVTLIILLGAGRVWSADPIGHWTFDGTLEDATGAHNGAFFGGEPLYARGYDGKVGGALVFDGVNDYVEVADPDVALAVTDVFTLALWFKAASTDQSQKYLLSRNGGGGQYAIIYEYTDDRIDFFAPSRSFGDDPRAGGASEMPLADTDWHHIAYTNDGAVWSGYLDGVPIFTTDISFGLATLATSWWIGAANPTVNHVAGLIDDVRIYNAALSEDEVAELASGKVDVPCPPAGDTHCAGLTLSGPPGGFSGAYTFTASGSDESGDPLLYRFSAALDGVPMLSAGPQLGSSVEFQLRDGAWTVTATLDDDPACGDTAGDETCTETLQVLPAPPGLIAHYKLDGDLQDSAGAHHGVFSGDPAPLFVEGHDGTAEGALSFDGLDDHVEVMETPDLKLRDNFTLALWFKSATPDQFQKYLLSKNGPGGQYAIIYEYTDNRVDFYAPTRTGDDPRAGAASEMPLEDTDWHHIAYTYDGATWSGYIDGIQVFTRQIQFVLSDAFSSSWWIGSAHATANHVEGAIDDVRIYNHALSADEVQDLTGLPNPCPEQGDTHVTNLEVEGPPGGGAGTYIVDASGTDDSGDPVMFTFTASRGGPPAVIGPQADGIAQFDLSPGNWQITVTVDDDPLCPDRADDAARTQEVVIEIPRVLVAHWPFDGTLEDVEGSNDGTFFGGDPVFVEGHDGTAQGALSFDGVDDYMEVFETPELKLTERFTLALWFKSASTTQSQKYLLSKNGGGGQYAIIYEYTDDKIDFYAPTRLFGDDPRAGGASEMSLADTEWHHIAYAYDSTTWSGYIDGVQVFSRDISFALSDLFSSPWYVGAANPTVNYVEGAIDDVRIYNYGLTAQEIAGLAGSPAGPVFHRGDADDNGVLDLTDAILILNWLFVGGEVPTCLDAADADNSGVMDLTDPVRVLGYLFLGEPPPESPGPPGVGLPCGPDTGGSLGCASYQSCAK